VCGNQGHDSAEAAGAAEKVASYHEVNTDGIRREKESPRERDHLFPDTADRQQQFFISWLKALDTIGILDVTYPNDRKRTDAQNRHTGWFDPVRAGCHGPR
jgi:hypothetical protein